MRRNTSTLLVTALALTLGLGAIPDLVPSASATRLRTMQLADLVAEADVVVRGRVLFEQVPVWDAQRQRIYTDSKIIVDTVLHGRTTLPSVTVRQLGGVLGDIGQSVDGVGPLKPGTTVVLFLKTDGVRHYVVGMAQGRLEVVGRSGDERVVRDLDGATLVGKRTATLPLRYDALVSRIGSLGRGAN
ncbi:MAG: hypothetical protein ACI9WU_004989 [Myxococcota bacterium]|jgi:hypothetical protein